MTISSMSKKLCLLFLHRVIYNLIRGLSVEILASPLSLMVFTVFCFTMMLIQADIQIGTIFQHHVRSNVRLG
jgi:putative Mn2+ efflux pump MntP